MSMSVNYSPAQVFVNRTTWQWMGKSRRHAICLDHNTVSGVQRLWIDGSEIFKSGWKFGLTGHVFVPFDDASVEIYIKIDGEWRPKAKRECGSLLDGG